MSSFPYVITVSSEKGGVGKTTLATNLAIFLKALAEDVPVTIFSFDNHFTVDKMFSMPGGKGRGDVADLLMGSPVSELLQTGQYGVNFIASSESLADLKSSFKGPMILTRLLANSNLPGILIIDTRPDLDILTQNALFAADRVIIPVKDMPSLENCRNIFDLFDKRGLDKRSLSLIPCLIDSRIKYEGPFRDQRTLLKAYAINRGYRCFDAFISKSPKVESLNTNPDGRIYPILTYARGTEVFNQFMFLGRTVLTEVHDTPEPRARLFQEWQSAEEGRKKEAFFYRMEGVRPECLCCGNPVLQGSPAPAYYYETSDDSARGFLEEKCFLDFLMSRIYNINNLPQDDPARLILQESARDSIFVFRPAAGREAVEFNRFDTAGTPLSRKAFAWRMPAEGVAGGNEEAIYQFMSKTLGGAGLGSDAFLLIHPPQSDRPDAILRDENYRRFTRLKQAVAASFTVPDLI